MSPFAVRGEGRREREDGNYGLVIVRQETKKGESERERERERESRESRTAVDGDEVATVSGGQRVRAIVQQIFKPGTLD